MVKHHSSEWIITFSAIKNGLLLDCIILSDNEDSYYHNYPPPQYQSYIIINLYQRFCQLL